MSYVAPDGNTYKYRYRINSYGSSSGTSSYYIIIYSNYKVCFCKEVDSSHKNYYYTTAYKFNDGSVRLCAIHTVAGTKTYLNGYITGTNPGYDAYSYGSMGDNDDAFSSNWVCMATPSFAQTQTDFPIFDTNLEALAYVTEPEVFQIPSFSFSGSILPGKNSSLNQGSCSLASPYTTSFSFEGKCIEKYSAPNGQVYNYKYSYYGVMTYQGFTADFDVYSNIKIGVLSTDRRAYALYNGVKTQVDIKSAPAGTYTNASQGTSPNDDKVRYNGNAGVSNHIEHCYYSRSGANGYTLVMTQQDGYPVNFSTTFPTFATESALLEYLSS